MISLPITTMIVTVLLLCERELTYMCISEIIFATLHLHTSFKVVFILKENSGSYINFRSGVLLVDSIYTISEKAVSAVKVGKTLHFLYRHSIFIESQTHVIKNN